MTRHSNLSEVHAVFHLVADDSLLGDINSRHAVILGLRNILKACFKYDIITITIPLLLTLEMTEVGNYYSLLFTCMKISPAGQLPLINYVPSFPCRERET